MAKIQGRMQYWLDLLKNTTISNLCQNKPTFLYDKYNSGEEKKGKEKAGPTGTSQYFEPIFPLEYYIWYVVNAFRDKKFEERCPICQGDTYAFDDVKYP